MSAAAGTVVTEMKTPTRPLLAEVRESTRRPGEDGDDHDQRSGG